MKKKLKKSKKVFSPGFSIYIMGIKCIVFFKYFDYKNMTKCFLLIDDKLIGAYGHFEFVGTSKVNLPDIYNKKTGEQLALQKAIDKAIRLIDNIVQYQIDFLENFSYELNDRLFYKLEKRQKL